MRIGLCSDSFLPVVDGVGRVVHAYAERLSARGHEVYVITPVNHTAYRGGFPFEIVDYLSIPTPTGAQYRTGVATLDPHYMERIRGIGLDILHAHSPATAGMEALRLAEKLGVPCVGTFHSKYYDDILKVTHSEVLASVGAYTVASFYKRCTEVWTVSEHAKATLREYGYEGDIQIVRNGNAIHAADAANLARARTEFALDDTPLLLYVGQIDNKKNLPRILEAGALLKARGLRFRIVFAGKGADKKALEAQAKALGLNCLFTGHITDTALLDGLYEAASLFVFPSLYDTAGLVVGEAALMDTPSVVVRDTAPAERIRDGENGLLCEDTPQSLAQAIARYLALDAARRAAMAKAARETLPISWDAVMDDVEARYAQLVAAHSEAPREGLWQRIRD